MVFSLLILLDFGFTALLSVIISYEKIIMERKYIQPFSLMLLYGLFGLMSLGLVFLIGRQFPPNEYTGNMFNFSSSFLKQFSNWKDTALTILYMIQYFEMYTIIYPHETITTNMLINLNLVLKWIYNIIFDFDLLYFVIAFISSIVLIIGILVYVEFITVFYFEWKRIQKN